MSKLWIITKGERMAIRLIHPGEHLAEELKELDMSAAELARNLNVPTNRITAILHGQRSITGDTALRLGHFFGTAPEFWLNLQNIYELRLAQSRAGKSVRSLPRLKPTKRVPA
jgi:addiction module HigA family antidote